MSKSFDDVSQDEKTAPILRVAASAQGSSLDKMLLEGRSMSGHERNCMFLNTLSSEVARNQFATVSAVSGLDFDDDGRAAAQVDWDHDGDIDLLLSNRNAPRIRFMRNDLATSNNFVQLRLVGNGKTTSRNAIGARVTVFVKTDPANPGRIHKTLRAGDGYLTQSTQWIHFGLGKDDEIEKVEVRWPNQTGEAEVYEGIDSNQRFRLVQGQGRGVLAGKKRAGLAIKPSTTNVPVLDPTMRIPLLHQLKAPDLRYVDGSGSRLRMNRRDNEMVLVNLWSSSCEPCVGELSQLVARHDELKKAGVRILALNIDELQFAPDALADAQKMARRLKFPFAWGMAPAELIQELQRFHNALIKMQSPLPMPASFLINRKGRLDTIYKGVVSVDTLLKDAQPGNTDLLERFVRSAPLTGRVLVDPIVNESMEQNEASALIRLAKDYAKQNQLLKAELAYLDALAQVPDSASIHNHLGVIYGQQRKNDKAIKHYKKAHELNPDEAAINNNIAQILIRQRKYDEAIGYLDSAIEAEPKNANAHYNRGLIHGVKQETAKERERYESAINIDPKHTQALYRLGLWFENQSNTDKARSFFEDSMKSSTQRSVPVMTALARVLVTEGAHGQAEVLLSQAINADPRYAESRFQMGRLYLKLKRFAEARQYLLATLQINRNHQGAKKALESIPR